MIKQVTEDKAWIFIVAGIVSRIYSATHGEQPTWLNVFLLYTFFVISYGDYTLTRHFQSKDDGNGM